MATALLATDHIFLRTPTGVFDTYCFGKDFFGDYLSIFDRIEIVCRMRDVSVLPSGASHCDLPDITFHGVGDGRGLSWLLAGPQKARAVLRPLINKADAVIAREPSVIGRESVHLALNRQVPVMLEIIGDPWESIRHISPRPHYLATAWLASRKLRWRSQRANVISYVSATHLPHRYPGSVKTVTDVISSIRLDREDIAAPRSFVTEPSPLKLVLVASLVPIKRHKDLLNAVSTCVRRGFDISVTLMGGGVLRQDLEAHAEALGIASRVHFHGHVADRKEIFRALDDAHLFVMCSASEGLPRALLEAMARGLPAIGSDVGGIRELLSPEARFPVGDVATLSRKIIEIGYSPALLSEMSERAVGTASAFTSDVLTPRRRKLYAALRNVDKGTAEFNVAGKTHE